MIGGMTATVETVRACPESDVRERVLTYVEHGGRNFLLTRWNGEIRAYRNLCKHQFLVMDDCDVDADSLRCPYHTVRYFLATGEVKDDSGFMGVDALTRYPARVVDGWVHVEVPKTERW
jgi:nitrite reductase/ring-hydroxylating ferredoxin subunit